jgi:microcystin-dependent protein
MSTPYIGEIRIVGFNFAPQGWELCQGQLLPISQFDALFNLIGTTYGGDGMSTFALPDLRGRIPVHQGTGYIQGQAGGSEAVTLQTPHLPVHSHVPLADGTGVNSPSPVGAVWGSAVGSGTPYSDQTAAANAPMSTQAVGVAGGGQPHENMLPFLCVNFIIAVYGIYPTQ